MGNWKIQSRRNYKLHARVKGAGCWLVMRNGIPVPPLRTPFLSAPPCLWNRQESIVSRIRPDGRQRPVRLPGEIRGYATGAETRNGMGTLVLLPCSRPHMEFTNTSDALVNSNDAFMNYYDAFVNSV